jgi:hypothetical protein
MNVAENNRVQHAYEYDLTEAPFLFTSYLNQPNIVDRLHEGELQNWTHLGIDATWMLGRPR